MFLTVIILASPGSGHMEADPEVVRSALTRHQDPAGPIEHIRVRAVSGEVQIGVLSLTATQAEADAAASAMCADAMAGEPALDGWRPRRAPARGWL